MLKLTLVIPDLFKPIRLKQVSLSQLPDLSNLQKILSRSQVAPDLSANHTKLLSQMLGIEMRGEGSLPNAALGYLADVGDVKRGWYVRADPVYLQVSRDQLILMDDDLLKLSDEEATQLIKELNHAFQDQGFVIQQGTAARWYLHLTEDPQIQTHSLIDVIGRNIQGYLMAGEAQQRWRAFMNEAQMLLHASEVNAARIENGKHAVNSIWLWGEGTLEQLRQASPLAARTQVYVDDPVLKGLATFAGAEVASVPDDISGWLAQADTGAEQVIVLDQPSLALKHGDLSGWIEALEKLDTSWLPALSGALYEKILLQLNIHDANGHRYLLTPSMLRRWWKPKRSLNRLIDN